MKNDFDREQRIILLMEKSFICKICHELSIADIDMSFRDNPLDRF